MNERDDFAPHVADQDSEYSGLTQPDLETLYVLGDPRGIAALHSTRRNSIIWKYAFFFG